MAEVTMPKLSDTMEEGKILRWLKQAGDRVEVGDLLVEVETDKADMEVEASAAGVLREVKLQEGDSAPVGAVIAVIDGEGDGGGAKPARAPDARPAANAEPEGPGNGAASPAPRRDVPRAAAPAASAPKRADAPATTRPSAPATTRPSAPATTRPSAPAATRPSAPARAADGVKASPLARALAEELGVDLATVRGTGPANRITRRDVEEASARATAAERKPGGESAAQALEETPARETAEGAEPDAGVVARRPEAEAHEEAASRARPAALPAREARERAPAEPEPAAQGERVRRAPLSKMRATIAKRMAESMREAPHFYLTTVVEMDEAVRLREQLKRLEVAPHGVTYNHMVLKAVADSLVVFPEINARFAGDAIEMLDEINLGIATAVDEGLIVPVLHDAARLGLLDLAREARALAERLETGKLTSADLSGATFSVSNLGMFDVDSFTAVINPPQAAILAVGSVKQRPVVRDGALAVGATMAMTLSCDHRVIDGVRGGRFLAEVKRRLESPVALLLPGGASG